MSVKTLKKTINEINYLLAICIFSMLISPLLLNGLAYLDSPEPIFLFPNDKILYSIKIMFVIIESITGLIWFISSMILAFSIFKIQKKHSILFNWKKDPREILEEERKGKTFALIRDLIAFYRGFHKIIMILTIFSLIFGTSLFISNIFTVSLTGFSFLRSILQIFLPIILMMVSTIVYIKLSNNWGKKLVRVSDEEKKLQIFLGDAIET